MSRWIDAEWLMNFFTDIPDNFTLTIGNLRATVNDAPSIDIVTCYMCKHSHMTYDGQCKYCDNITDDDGNVIEVYFDADHFCSYGSRSEKPNNCEHITEDGVTCAKYPACDDCPDNPLNKVKGSERLVKGSEKPNNSEIPTGSERSRE